MTAWVALFRGINVGGKNILPMAELRAELEELGLGDVATYIQSGNVVFGSGARSAAKLQETIEAAVQRSHGFRPPVLVLAAKELSQALRKNPFPGVSQPKALHFFFLFARPRRPDLAALAELATPTEELRLVDRVLYLHAPDGIGRSKLATRVEKHLGVPATARNLRTVQKLAEMMAVGR